MKRRIMALLGVLACFLFLAGCRRYEPMMELTETESAQGRASEEIAAAAPSESDAPSLAETEPAQEEPEQIIHISTKPDRVRVKGIYLTANTAGSESRMDEIISYIDQTELNAVVIDVKDDFGNVTFQMDSPVVNEIQAVKVYIHDMPALAEKLKAHGIYMIARIPAFRDPYLAEKKPEWCLKKSDGSIYTDRNGQAWVDPYKRGVWEYLIEIAEKAGEIGFDEIQFDYVRFCTESGMDEVVFDPEDTQGMDKTQIITEFIQYAYERLSGQGLYVSADVFGTIIGSAQDAQIVGQSYGEMAENLDYICPMIYPSHYGNGNFGLDYPDAHPYETILGALNGSQKELAKFGGPEKEIATVRPWLQDFTASYLEHYIEYGDEEIRAQIQAVYDAGYDEWILWSAANRYHYGGLLTPEAAAEEDVRIQESRAAAEAAAAESSAAEPAAEDSAGLPEAEQTPAAQGSFQGQEPAPQG